MSAMEIPGAEGLHEEAERCGGDSIGHVGGFALWATEASDLDQVASHGVLVEGEGADRIYAVPTDVYLAN